MDGTLSQVHKPAQLFKRGEASHLKAPIIDEHYIDPSHKRSESAMATHSVSKVLTSRIDTNDSFHDLHEWSDHESMEPREPDSATTYEEYALNSIYARDSDCPSERSAVAPTKEQLEAARKEINESKQRIDKRLS